MKSIFSSYSKIARNAFINLRPILQPNYKYAIGIQHQVTSSMVNPAIYNMEQKKPLLRNDMSPSYDGVGGRGEIYIPKTNDNYIGGGVGEF
jgi:hypothetical protein